MPVFPLYSLTQLHPNCLPYWLTSFSRPHMLASAAWSGVGLAWGLGKGPWLGQGRKVTARQPGSATMQGKPARVGGVGLAGAQGLLLQERPRCSSLPPFLRAWLPALSASRQPQNRGKAPGSLASPPDLLGVPTSLALSVSVSVSLYSPEPSLSASCLFLFLCSSGCHSGDCKQYSQ